MSALKICVTVKARILKLDIHMNNELLYRGIENWGHCCYSSLYLSIFFCLSKENLCHSFFVLFFMNCSCYSLQIWLIYMENE